MRGHEARASDSPTSESHLEKTASAIDDGVLTPFGRTDEMLPEIDGYEMLSRIHSGAQGIVYKAVQKSTGRTVAVKLLPHEHAATDRQKHRFEREVGLAASLRHPNIVTVYDSGLTSGRYFYAMEYIRGQPLDQYVKSSDADIAQRLRLFASICAAISYAHQKGVIHRDLKPANILVDSAGEPHVVDFGLAKSAGVVAMHGDTPVTLTNQFMGTLAYASPEQTKGDPSLIDMRSDIYSLGVILFEMLTSQYPYPLNPDLVKMFHTICNTPPKAPSSVNHTISGDIDTIALRALAKDPARRYQTVAELQQDVEHWLAGEPISARRDSVPYLLRMKGRRLVQRRRISTLVTIVFASAITTSYIASWLLREWTWPVNWFEHALTSVFPPQSAAGVFENVRIIAIDDDVPDAMKQMAENVGIADVSPENWKSIRRLHGRLMQRLAQCGVKAVVCDLTFADEQPFNDELIAGVKALQQAGVNAVVGVRRWEISAEQPPEIAPSILSQKVGWGGTTLAQDEVAPWRADLIVQRGDSAQFMGLGLAALGAMRHPLMDVSIHLDPESESIQLRYFPANPALLQSSALAEIEYLKLSSVRVCDQLTVDDVAAGLHQGDLIGQYVFLLPDDATYAAATIPYRKAFEANDSQLREWFGNKLVLLGDMRSPPASNDWYGTPDGRVLSGPHGHAAAIDALLRNAVAIRYPRGAMHDGLMIAAGVLGLALTRLPARRLPVRSLVIFAAVLLLAAFAFAGYRLYGILWTPFGAALAMIFTYVGVVLVSTIRSADSPTTLERSYHT